MLVTLMCTGHVNETDSHFEYIGNDYSFYNDGWDTHIPTFRDELTAPSIVQGICGSDLQCIFDYAVTNDVSFAAATHTVTISNQETQDILCELSDNNSFMVIFSTTKERVHNCFHDTHYNCYA